MKILSLLSAILPAINQFLPGVQKTVNTARATHEEFELAARKNIHAEFSSINSSLKVSHDEEGKDLDFSDLDVCARIVPIELAASPLNKSRPGGEA